MASFTDDLEPGWLGRTLGRVTLEMPIYEWVQSSPPPDHLRRVLAVIKDLKVKVPRAQVSDTKRSAPQQSALMLAVLMSRQGLREVSITAEELQAAESSRLVVIPNPVTGALRVRVEVATFAGKVDSSQDEVVSV